MVLLSVTVHAQPTPAHQLRFDHLAKQWDEAIPLGNGIIGALIWQKEQTMRISLDRADLWDERTAFPIQDHNFEWVRQQVVEKNYSVAQAWGDGPYDAFPYPTKLPAAAISFHLEQLGTVKSNVLDIATATHCITFDNGTTFTSFVHASKPVGYFEIANFDGPDPIPQLIPHQYGKDQENGTTVSVVEGQRLSRLGYRQGTVKHNDKKQRIHQTTYGNEYFEVLLQWKKISPSRLVGLWTIVNNRKADLTQDLEGLHSGNFKQTHVNWWRDFWSKSMVSIPDKTLERQYFFEIYKLGCVSRRGAPAITLQAIWTADNNGLPPWKGDFHNDLNTQLSYWPTYTSNHLTEAKTFVDWLWNIRRKNKAYTKQYFGVDGLNVPGVATLSGDPMGGWIQYALSPTVSAWTAQHVYWQWKYNPDERFLKDTAYIYISEAATYLKNITHICNGKRYLPLSSSPEYNDNKPEAWFTDWTNFDLSLAHYLFEIAAETSYAAGKSKNAAMWLDIKAELPELASDESGLLVATNQALQHSHRHMSPYMAIYPLGLLDANNPSDRSLITQSLRHLEKLGTRSWVGYSFAWMACLYARAGEGDNALQQLQKFANNFCSVNSFHLNGDQRGGQYSAFTYRPFTLEGNFAFAQGIHEILLQSKGNYVELFPAVPTSWKNFSFHNFRTIGGFLISAEQKNDRLQSLKIRAERTGKLVLLFNKKLTHADGRSIKQEHGRYVIPLAKGEQVELKQAV
ncbi:glycoside hydrolase N-terminal domain-containing protein [Sphingobacterium suaedae]|uniref:Glycoside hydrolase N-terminal domain-containing protein n=2 Tax=Sphingobacterium suaedae TaxID=1686402 RepID=A0ABW5KH29_9SPHI